MKVSIGTTTGFHLRRLAVELHASGVGTRYFSAMPNFRLRRDGLSPDMFESLFWPLTPISALALMRQLPGNLQDRAVQARFGAVDALIAKRLEPCDAFIGLSAMSVRSARRARELGAKVVIERGSRHVLSQHELLIAGGGAGLEPRYIERELAGYAEADVITVLSSHAADSFVERGVERSRLFVCPLGVDLSVFRPTPRPSGPTNLLFVGAWSHRKGVDLLVEAVRRRADWRLTHVGAMADAAFPEDPRIVSVGHRDHQGLARIMAEHHILVLPSREDGFGMVLLEALASGLPVVASRMTGAPDIREMIDNKDHVGLTEAGDADDLLRGLDEMVTREASAPLDRERLSPTDREALSWRSYGARYQFFLETLTGRPVGSLTHKGAAE
jgi:starch synthase